MIYADRVVLDSFVFDPFGQPQGSYSQTPYGFTGEWTDENDHLYLRARYYSPEMGVFTALDPFEGLHARPMSLNGYSWVEGNVPNAIDPRGMQSLPGGFECNQVPEGSTCPPAYYTRHGEIFPMCEPLDGSGMPVLPRIAWEQFWRDNGCLSSNIDFGDIALGIADAIIDIVSVFETQIPDEPCAEAEWKGGLYIEGAGILLGAILNFSGGKETIYDFANMEKSYFLYPGAALATNIGGSVGYYAAAGGSFVRDKNLTVQEEHTNFAVNNQYAGMFLGAEGNVSLPIIPISFAVGGFASPPWVTPNISATYISVGTGLSTDDFGAFGGMGNSTYYFNVGNPVSFADEQGFVDEQNLVNDIMGSSSPGLPSVYQVLYEPFRLRIADVARKWAQVYNTRTNCKKGIHSPYPDDELNRIINNGC